MNNETKGKFEMLDRKFPIYFSTCQKYLLYIFQLTMTMQCSTVLKQNKTLQTFIAVSFLNATVRVIRNGTLIYRELHSLRCINFKNICPKHPQLAQFNGSGTKL